MGSEVERGFSLLHWGSDLMAKAWEVTEIYLSIYLYLSVVTAYFPPAMLNQVFQRALIFKEIDST